MVSVQIISLEQKVMKRCGKCPMSPNAHFVLIPSDLPFSAISNQILLITCRQAFLHMLKRMVTFFEDSVPRWARNVTVRNDDMAKIAEISLSPLIRPSAACPLLLKMP